MAIRLSPKNVRCGFTLLELLAVIAVIGILAAIIIPVAGRAGAAAKDARCRSNLRQLHHGFVGYVAATGKMPRRMRNEVEEENSDGTKTMTDAYKDGDPGTGGVDWYRNIYVYLSIGQGAANHYPNAAQAWETNLLEVYTCPSDARRQTGARSLAQYRSITGDTAMNNEAYQRGSYIWNNRLNDLTEKHLYRTTLAAEIKNNPIVLLDGRDNALAPIGYVGFYEINNNARFRHGASSDYDIKANKAGGTLPPEHGHLNAVMYDGSVRSFKEGGLPRVQSGMNPTRQGSDTKQGINGYDIWAPW